MVEQVAQGAGTASVVVAAAHLSAADARGVLDLVEAAARSDGGEPLAEDARLALRRAPTPGSPEVLHLLARQAGRPAGAVTGYAQARTTPPPAPGERSAGQDGAGAVTVELLVHPAARRRGVGTALARRLAAELPGGLEVRAWSHTGSPAAAALAHRAGLRAGRELWRMERTVDAPTDLPALTVPEGVALRAFEPGRDEEAWLRLNARAFAGHPEQGTWGRADLDARTAEPWFDPAGLLLAVAADDRSHLLAAHWTKRGDPAEPTRGEVYVVGVDPGAQGRGLGRVVTLAGLHHLAALGVRRVDLYVDGDNAAARRTYTGLGFARAATDVVYEGRS